MKYFEIMKNVKEIEKLSKKYDKQIIQKAQQQNDLSMMK